MCILTISCGEIFEKNLGKEPVTLLSPTNNYETTTLTQNFWWEEIKGATKYNLQIVSPSFSSINQMVLDTNLIDNLYTFTLSPGQYQWRVKAMNESSSTAFVTYNLTIDTTSELTNQIIVLQQPLNNSYSNTLNRTLSWLSLSNATFYNVQVTINDFSLATNMILDTMVSTSTINFNFPSDNSYQWRVKALNSSGSSIYSSPYNLMVDITPPNTPLLLLPENHDTITAPFTMFWNRGTETGSPITDSLYIYSDSLITIVYKKQIQTTSYTDSLGSGSYFWRVRSLDAAGNISPYSATKKFLIQ